VVFVSSLTSPAVFSRIAPSRSTPASERATISRDLARLDQRERLGQLVEGPEAARHDDKAERVLEEQHLAHEEVVAGDDPIEVRVDVLLERQLDIAASGAATDVLRAAVGRLHDARPATRHHGEAVLRQESAKCAGLLGVAVIFGKPRGAKDRHAWSDEVERAKAP
jgi:hypothetical protein